LETNSIEISSFFLSNVKISALGIFNVRLCTASNALAAMGDEIGWPMLGMHLSRYKTPWVSILILSMGIGIFVLLPFDILVQIDMAIYSLSLSMQFLALYWLRRREPDLKRPYQLPFGERGVLIFIILPVFLCLMSLSYTIIFAKHLTSQVVLLFCIFCGIPLFYLIERLKKRRGYQPPSMELQNEESPFLPDEPSPFSIEEGSHLKDEK
jgi:amino acid transporter